MNSDNDEMEDLGEEANNIEDIIEASRKYINSKVIKKAADKMHMNVLLK